MPLNRARKFLLIVFLVGVSLTTFSIAHAQYQIKTWTTDNGLPQNTVYSILQTPDGYLWLATLDGLLRFDGVKFTVFNKSNTKGIESNRFTELVIDANNDLWVGTENGGITRYHDGEFQTFSVSSNKQSVPVWNLSLDKSGKVTVFTTETMSQWDGQQFIPYTPIAGETIDSIRLWTKSGEFWYSNLNKLYRVKNGQITSYPTSGSAKEGYINKLYEDSRGRIWFGTTNIGLFFIENGKLNSFTVKDGLPSNYVSPRIEDRSGNLWAVTDKGAVIVSPNGKISVLSTEQGLSDNVLSAFNSLNSVCEDREGNIWIGTIFRGLNRVSYNSVTFYSKKDGLAADVVNPIYQTGNGDIFIGGRGLTRYASGKFSEIKDRFFSSSDVTAIEQDRSGRLWFGHWGGVYYFENGKYSDFNSKLGDTPQIADIHEDRTGALWFAANRGLFRYQNDTTTKFTIQDGLAGEDVKIIHESTDGTLWIGTYSGLSELRNGAFTSFTTADGLASNKVRSIYEDADGVLWIGSYDGGLTRLKNGQFTRYTINDGLFNDGVFQILEDERSYLWMSCNRGIYRVPKQQLNDFADGKISRIESIALGKSDGLLETECNGGQQPAGIRTRDGELWFPTQKGVAVIKPDSIKVNPLAPPVVIELAKIDNENVNAADRIEIAPGKNNLEISYTALSFVKPEFIKFRYRLEGQDENWIEAGDRRTAYYSYLPSGEYTFQVIAANADGVWNIEGAKRKIVVKPPVYRTWWFWILALAIVSGAAYFFYRWRVAQLEWARRAQEEFSRKLLTSQEQERQRIASELHDSIGQSLLIIKNRAFLALADLDEPETVREQLEELSESATGAIEECREISYNLRPYQINRFGLTKTLEAIFRRISEVTEIETTVELDSIDDIFSPEAETNVYRIVQESVNNIIKHSAASEADFFVKRRGAEVDILIQDNGRGFDRNALNENGNRRGGFGLIGMNERARMLGGVYEIDSAQGKGTTIKIKLAISASNERN